MNELLYQMIVYIRSGGVVMVPILCVSLVMWVLIFNRLFFLHRLYVKNMPRAMAGELVRENLCPDKRYKGANAFLVRAFLSRRSPVSDPGLDERILDETVMNLTASLDRHLALIGVLSAVAPLMGLLGTVVGMMETFDVITVFGTGNVRAMASGISVALVTTQTGLMISIPGLYMSGWLNRRASNLKHRIASTAMYLKPFIRNRRVSC
ncbi:MotA/TolQ/ExbB proton channel family protein [Desulfobacter curvatus]|uniref:MotA/TolQ/ExbB proton channel family protein n=1 Tax=Desulfobacter curvatus TaxID=2290 RepID=UPI00035D4AC6|nr:MotA/TolQ/ExbB proton channel family protein [Desulfobacter curvatus]